MNLELDYKIDPLDMTLMSLKGIYKTIVGIVNIVFTFASIGLLIRFWADLGILLKVVLIITSLAFPIFQPIVLYNRAKRQLANINKSTKMRFDYKGFHITIDDLTSSIPWKKVKRVSKTNRAFVLYVSEKEGYILSKKLLGDNFELLYNFIIDKTNIK